MEIHAESDSYYRNSNGEISKKKDRRTTWGCIAITGGKDDVHKFFNLTKGQKGVLTINTNNPKAYKTDVFKIGGGASGGVKRIYVKR